MRKFVSMTDSIPPRYTVCMRRALSLVFLTVALAGCFRPSNEDIQKYFDAGRVHGQGVGVPVDKVKAAEWYLKAAKYGHTEAQYNVGVLYYDGLGVPKNRKESSEWFLKAARQGYIPAQYNVANAYRTGDGVEQNFASAISWYMQAAQEGYAPAQYNLGAMKGNGEGTPQNYAEAYYWLLLAQKQGYPPSGKYLQNFAPSLSKDVRATIQQQVEAASNAMRASGSVMLP